MGLSFDRKETTRPADLEALNAFLGETGMAGATSPEESDNPAITETPESE
jgi:hypothetical protein